MGKLQHLLVNGKKNVDRDHKESKFGVCVYGGGGKYVCVSV